MRFFILLCSLVCVLFGNEDLPAPYNTLENLLPFDEGDWYQNRVPMESLLKEIGAKITKVYYFTMVSENDYGISSRYL